MPFPVKIFTLKQIGSCFILITSFVGRAENAFQMLLCLDGNIMRVCIISYVYLNLVAIPNRSCKYDISVFAKIRGFPKKQTLELNG